MAAPEIRLFDKCTPLVPAGGLLDVEVKQDLRDDPAATSRLMPGGSSKVKFVVEGPQLKLTPDDIGGVYPAPGSEDSPDEFLPHVALRRHTLPWERVGSYLATPWLALLVFKKSELAFTAQKAGKPGAVVHTAAVSTIQQIDSAGYQAVTAVAKVPTTATADWVYVTNDQIQRLFPTHDDLAHLCHVKRVTEWDPKLGKNVDTDHAIVIANRLPDAGPDAPDAPAAEPHVALLVSLEQRADLWALVRKNNPAGRAALVVLHHWTFTPSKGGDFEQVVRAIRFRPNGGVLRFGSLPEGVRQGGASLSGGFATIVQPNGAFLEPLDHAAQDGQVTPVAFRGPLRPFAPAARGPGFAVRAAPEEWEGDDVTDDYTYAAAFELGRLLVLADAGLLEDLRDMRPKFPPIETPIEANPLPPVLQKPDWVMDNPWAEQPWEMAGAPMLEKTVVVLKDIEFDPGGIAGHVGQWGGVLKGTLEPLGMPSMPVITGIDLGTVTVEKLGVQFVAVLTAAQS